jgi:hypothetical protein
MNVRTVLVMLVANAAVTTALVLGYVHWMAPAQPPRLAVLDVGEIYRLKEMQVTAVLMKGDATEEERSSALKAAGAFGNEVTNLLRALHEECQCLVLARGAVIGQPLALPDLTLDVRRRLGL